MSDKKNTEIAVNEGFAALANRDVLNEAMADDCQGLEFSFDRVKLPAGGGTAFEIPSAESDESEMVKDITGVIVYNHSAYAYYHDKYTGGNNPPDCGSFDGVTGIGTPGGNCASCPYNKFGSGEGQSKMCKNKRMLYILREGELFPITLSLPTGSLKSFTNYVKSQLSRGRKLNQVVTKITLKKATNASGIAFSQAVFAFERMSRVELYTELAKFCSECKGIHLLSPSDLPENTKFQMVFGASNIVDDVKIAIDRAFETIAKINAHESREVLMVQKTVLDQFFNQDEVDLLTQVLIPQPGQPESYDTAYGIFLGYQLGLNPEGRGDDFEALAEQKMLCDIKEHAGYIAEKISSAGLTGHSFYVYVVPFNDAEQEKTQIMDAVLRGGTPI